MNRTTLKLWATIDAEMDDDSADALGVSLCQILMEHLLSQQIPVGVVTSIAEHD